MDRKEFFTALADRFNADELRYVQRAYWLVKNAHSHQVRRLTGERFFEHLRRVAYFPTTLGYFDPQMVTLGLLHDVVEDTWVPQDVIVNLFGQGMYHDVLMLSKEYPAFHPVTGSVLSRAKIGPEVYLQGLWSSNKRVQITKGSDRYDNLKDLDQWEPARQQKYVKETNELLPLFRTVDMRIALLIEERLAVALPVGA